MATPDKPDMRRKWYLNRGISIDSLIAIIALLAGGGAIIIKQESRLTNLESSSKQHEKDDTALYKKIETDRQEMREDIKEIRRLMEAQVRDTRHPR